MTSTKPVLLRDRDAIVTEENIIFRVYGYAHPPNAFVCDPEYAPENLYHSRNQKAYRRGIKQKTAYCKFYFDEGLRFIQKNYPKHTVFYAPLRKHMVGVKKANIKKVRNPKTKFERLIANPPKDALVKSLQELYRTLNAAGSMAMCDFGVFGSLLHGFYHPEFSDLDLIIYGRKKLETLRELLKSLYEGKCGFFRNEFDNKDVIKGKQWQFRNYSAKDFLWHQRRKLIYGLWKSPTCQRTVKVEFEPVKNWKEIDNEYAKQQQITRQGWIKATARVIDASDAPFMPAIYKIEPLKILCEVKVDNILRVLSFVEEFRMQAKKDEIIYVEGNLEKVTTATDSFHQITLSYGPRYFEQALKVKKQ